MRTARAIPVLVALTLVGVVSCGDDDDAADSTTATTEQATPASAGTSDGPLVGAAPIQECEPARPFEAGDHPGSNVVGEIEQNYWVVVPPSYDGVNPVAVYLLLPGGAGSAEPALAGWGPSLAGLDALVVVPDVFGLRRDVDVSRALVDKVASEYCVAPTQVYAVASSSSAGQAGRLMAHAPDVIAASAIGLGSFGAIGLEPTSPVPVLAWTGDPDRQRTTEGVEVWVGHNGCAREPTVSDLGSEISWSHYEGCDAAVEFYDFVGMGHRVPVHDCHGQFGYCAEYAEFDFWEVVSEFFAENPRPPR